jgi:hypothetical protein
MDLEVVMSFAYFGSDEEVEAVAEGMMRRTLEKARWTHAAHFATVLWLLARRKDVDVERELPGMIRGYNESIGGANTDSGGYHETITMASVRAARGFLAGREERSVFAVCNELMTTEMGKSDWLLRYWSRERLFSVEARRCWVEPDVEPMRVDW